MSVFGRTATNVQTVGIAGNPVQSSSIRSPPAEHVASAFELTRLQRGTLARACSSGGCDRSENK